MRNTEDAEQVGRHYLEGLEVVTKAIKEGMLKGGHLVVGGPYPNSGYNSMHLQVASNVFQQIRTWTHVDHVIDFLAPVVHDGKGKWHAGYTRDPSHPNAQGH